MIRPPGSNRSFTVLSGLVLAAGGALAFVNPLAASVTGMAILSVALIAAGVLLAWAASRAGPGRAGVAMGLLAATQAGFGTLLMIHPATGIASLTGPIAAFFLISGGLRLWLAIAGDARWQRIWPILSGLAGIGLGLALPFHPNLTVTVLSYLMAVELGVAGIATVLAGPAAARA